MMVHPSLHHLLLFLFVTEHFTKYNYVAINGGTATLGGFNLVDDGAPTVRGGHTLIKNEIRENSNFDIQF